MKSLLRSKLFITLITAMVCIVAVIASLPREPKLLNVAQPTNIPIDNFPKACGTCAWEEQRTWLSETEMAIAQVETDVYDRLKPVDARFTIWNLQSGTHRDASADFPRQAGNSDYFPAISHDGTRVLWKDGNGTHISDLVTGRRLNWPDRSGSADLGNYWFAGEKRWLKWDTMPDHVTVYDAAREGEGERYSFQRHGPDDTANGYSNPVLAANDHIIVTRQGRSSTTFLEFVLQAQQRRLSLLCSHNASPPAGYNACYCSCYPAASVWGCPQGPMFIH